MPTRILSVTRGPSGVWRIRTSDKQVYATKNMWAASLAERCREQKTDVEMYWHAGWHYRELDKIDPIKTEQSA